MNLFLLAIDWNQIGKNILNFFSELVVSVGMKLLWAILILFVGLKLTKLITKQMQKAKWVKRTDPSVAHFLINFINITLKVLIFVSAALVLGVPATSFVAILTSAGVAIGLALQGSLANLAGGIMILLFKPFREGDYIESGDVSGTVQDISIFYTTLVTPDNKVVHCPNGSLSNANVTNYSQKDMRRVDIAVNVAYDADTEQVKQLLIDTVSGHEKLLPDNPPFVRLKNCGDSSLEFTCRVWCKTADYWDVYFDLTEEIKAKLDEAGIEIPYPQMDVHIKDAPEKDA